MGIAIDKEMLKGNTLGIVVGNYNAELAKLKGRAGVDSGI